MKLPAKLHRVRPVRTLVLCALALAGVAWLSAAPKSLEQHFGFNPGKSGELTKYADVMSYFKMLSQETDRVTYHELGQTTAGRTYGMIVASSPENLKNLDRIIAINQRLADPRGLSEDEAKKLSAEGKPVYFLYAQIHSTEVAAGLAAVQVASKLATENTPDIRQILRDSVVLIMPSQNPDGQDWVADHWYKTKGTPFQRVFPDLYHKYTGHDDNRDWFMFTQKETLLNLGIQAKYRPVISHDMHQMGGNGARMWVPPFDDPFDRNTHPIIMREQATVGQAMAAALISAGKEGITWGERFDGWTPSRQYMIYKGQPRILTEIATGRLADPAKSRDGKPLGPQETKRDFPVAYSSDTWTLEQQTEYGVIAAIAGMKQVAAYGPEFLLNFYKIQSHWSNWQGKPYAFVVSAEQRDPYATYEMFKILETAEVELEQAKQAFTAAGKNYPAGSWIVKVAQPYGAFAKTMIEKQNYPDLRIFPGGPPKNPYDATGHTLGMLMGVTVDQIDEPFAASVERVKAVVPVAQKAPTASSGVYLIGPESYGVFKIVAALQKANIATVRTAAAFESAGKKFAPGTFVIPVNAASTAIMQQAAKDIGLAVATAAQAPDVAGFQLKPGTRVGLYRSANLMPGGWLMWTLEQYNVNHQVVTAGDFEGNLADKYDVIILPSGLGKTRVVKGLDQKLNDPKDWAWAAGVGEKGWAKLRQWVKDGGTLLAIGTATETARELLDLPIEKVLPEPVGGRGEDDDYEGGGAGGSAGEMVPASAVKAAMKDAFSSPTSLMYALRDQVSEPTSRFFCPGSLLANEFYPEHPVAWGMPAEWPVFFIRNQAYRVRPQFGIKTEVAAKYPRENILQSGWLLGEDYLKDQANVVSFEIGKGYVVTFGTHVDFRAQARATQKLVFNAMYHGPSKPVTAAEIATLMKP